VFADSVGGFDGRLVGTATRAAAGLLDGGSAIDLTGGGYVEIPYDPALATNAFSVSMWLRVDGSTSERMSPFSNRGSPYYLGWNLYTFGELQGMIGDGSAWEGVAGGTVTAGAVAHVVVTYDDAVGALSLYVDGVLLDADSHGHALNPSAGLTIGALNDGGSWPFVGVIDGVALWDRALDASEVEALFAAGCE
jgi:hypothetical protein